MRRRRPRKRIYLIGSLRNPEVPKVAALLREEGFDVFDEWYSAGPRADEHLLEYAQARGLPYAETLALPACRNAYLFDKRHIDAADIGVLVMPAGRSGHLELGYMVGAGKIGIVMLDSEPERLDIMHNFASAVVIGVDALRATLRGMR
jgi:hypothetical protein